MPLMAFAGPSLPLSAPPPSSRPRSIVNASSIPNEAQSKPQEFIYDRAIPSIRWPNLNLDQLYPIPRFPVSPPIPSPESEPETLELESEKEILELESVPEALETLESKQTRTQIKKLNKLALKRANDWRQRVQFLTDRILTLPPSASVADVLNASRVQMNPNDYALVIKNIGSKSWQRSLEVFKWLTLCQRQSPFPRLLASIISVLGRAHQESVAEEIFLQFVDESEPCVQVYNAIMGVYARTGNCTKVQEFIGLMRSKGLEPDLVSFNTLINARAKSRNMPRGSAVELLNEVRRSGLCPDSITYNTLISACAYSLNLEDAVKVFRVMEEANCCPDLWTYNSMVLVYAKCGMVQDAERVFLELGNKGFSPDAVTYNSILNAYAKEGNIVRVKEVCDEMVRSGFQKDEITYNTLIHMYGKRGDLEVALELYEELKEVRCKPDAVTYTVLIDLFGKADRISEAKKVMAEMVKARVKPTVKTFSALICGYAKTGMREEAHRTFDFMVRSGVKPDRLVYSIVLDSLLRCSETGKAMVLYRSMMRDGFLPDAEMYKVLVGALVKEKKDEEIAEVVKDMDEVCGMNPQVISAVLVQGDCISVGAEMLKRGVAQGYKHDRENLVSILNAYSLLEKHEETHSLLNFISKNSTDSHHLVSEASIMMLCKDNQLEAALEEYNKMIYGSKAFSCSLYECLITLCQKREFFYEASKLFSDMKFFGLRPSKSVYQSLITSYCNLGFPETAHHLLDEAQRASILFHDISIYALLVDAYGKLKLYERAESFVRKLGIQRVVNRKLWNALIYAYADSGLYEQARAVFDMMMKHGPQPSVDSVNGLMKALIVDGRLDELYVLVEELQDMNFKISKSTILMMLDAFARNGNIFEVKKIYHGMKAAGYLPTPHLYRSMISLLSREKRVRDVELMVSEMEEAGFKPDLAIFNSLLKMYTGIEDFEKTAEVIKNIRECGFEADEDTYNTLIVMYSRDLRPEEGFTLLNEMRNKGLEPKLDSYKSLLAACGKEKLWEQAEELFGSMRSKGYKLDRSFYHIMMKIYRNSGNHLKAQSLLHLMKEDGIDPTIATMHMLMASYGDGGQPHEAEKVLNNLKNSGLNLSTLAYSSVIDAYLKIRDYNTGITKVLEMKRDGVELDHKIWTCVIRAASFCIETEDAICLLNCLHDTGFDLPLRFLTETSESLFTELDSLLDKLVPEEDNASFNFVNALEDLLWAFERRATASWVLQLSIRKGIYRHDMFRYSLRTSKIYLLILILILILIYFLA